MTKVGTATHRRYCFILLLIVEASFNYLIYHKFLEIARGETMPNESLNIYLTAVDKASPVLASITDKTKALDKESQELQQTFEALQKANKGLIERKTELQKKLQEVNEEVKEARKSFRELGDEASSDAYEKAQEKQQKLRNEIAATTKALGENQKMYKENIEVIRKGSMNGEGASLSDVMAGLNIGEELSSLALTASGALANSALGSGMGDIVSNALGSAVTGATLGHFILPGLGTAIGAGVGGIIGAFEGAIQQWSNKDDAFKDYYGGLYEDVKGRPGEMVESGSTIAGGREQTRMAFAQRLGGEDEAREYLGRVETMAAKTNYDYDEITGYAKLLLNSYDPDEALDVLQNLSDATAGLNLSSSDVNMMISGLSRMRTTGKATQEYLNYFRERGVDVDQALADELGVDKSAVSGMVSKGQVGGEDAAAAILAFIEKEFGGLSDDLAGTYDAMVDNLGDLTASMEAEGGDAYNELRKEGIQAEMDALDGGLKEAMGEINAIMGENQARRENLEEQYMREALEAVLLGKEGSVFSEEENAKLAELSGQYAELKAQYAESGGTDAEAGAKLESLYEQTEALGKAYFENSDFVKTLNDIELDEIAAIRENTAGLTNATEASYWLGQELSKGRFAVKIDHGDVDYSTMIYTDDGGNLIYGSNAQLGDGYYDDGGNFRPYAFGLERVPYDEYPALLHEGERVLTAAQARAQDAAGESAGGIQLVVTGNSFSGTSEEMAEQMWAVIVRRLEQEAVARAPK